MSKILNNAKDNDILEALENELSNYNVVVESFEDEAEHDYQGINEEHDINSINFAPSKEHPD